MTEPLVPPEVDLSHLPRMPLDVHRLRDSAIVDAISAEAFRAAVLLWCAAWHQRPAASLPNDDGQLAKLAGYGRVVKEFRKIKKDALHGFVECSDGRLYHSVIAEIALETWHSVIIRKWERECDRVRKENKRLDAIGQNPLPFPDRPTPLAKTVPVESPIKDAGKGTPIPAENKPISAGRDAPIPTETALKVREGKVREPTSQRSTSGSEAVREAVPPDKPALNGKAWVEIGNKVLVLCGLDPSKWIGSYADVGAWIANGFDPDLDVYPAVEQRFLAKRKTAPSWVPNGPAYFTEAIREWHGRRTRDLGQMPAGPTNGAARPPLSAKEDRLADERAKLNIWFTRGKWPNDWGVRPDDPDYWWHIPAWCRDELGKEFPALPRPAATDVVPQ